MSDAELIRAFVAVNIPDEIRNHVAEITSSIYRNPRDLKIVKPENFHLTLAFIGDISEERLTVLQSPITDFSNGFKRFQARFGKIGTFPGVIFLKTIFGEEKLIDLASGVRTILRKNSIPYDGKPFRGHLTLARTRNRSAKVQNYLLDDIQNQTYDFSFQVVELSIYKSELTSSGPIYSTLYSFKLAPLSDQKI